MGLKVYKYGPSFRDLQVYDNKAKKSSFCAVRCMFVGPKVYKYGGIPSKL